MRTTGSYIYYSKPPDLPTNCWQCHQFVGGAISLLATTNLLALPPFCCQCQWPTHDLFVGSSRPFNMCYPIGILESISDRIGPFILGVGPGSGHRQRIRKTYRNGLYCRSDLLKTQFRMPTLSSDGGDLPCCSEKRSLLVLTVEKLSSSD